MFASTAATSPPVLSTRLSAEQAALLVRPTGGMIEIMAEHGGKSREGAKGRISELQQPRRYVRDVY